MSLEILRLLKVHIDQAKTTADIGTINILQAMFAKGIFDEYDQGLIDQQTAVTQIMTMYSQIYETALSIDRLDTEMLTTRYGFESLYTDTQDHRSADWFKATGKLFATGIPINCFVCAIIHSDKGMAASHRNTITLDGIEKHIINRLDDRSSVLNPIDFNPISGGLVTPESLTETVRRTVDEAFYEFSIIAPEGIPLEETIIIITGIDYLTDQLYPNVQQAALETTLSRINSEAEKIGAEKSITVNTDYLGKPFGINYGGKNHPTHSVPNVYYYP